MTTSKARNPIVLNLDKDLDLKHIFIDDQMIQKYQKLDTLLNYCIEKADSLFITYIFLKTALESYFVKYTVEVTPLLHNMSQDNIDFILSLSDLFDDADLAFIKAHIDVDQFYDGKDEQQDEFLNFKNNKEVEKDQRSNLSSLFKPKTNKITNSPFQENDILGYNSFLNSFKSFSIGETSDKKIDQNEGEELEQISQNAEFETKK